MTKVRIIVIVSLILAVLDICIIGCLADTVGSSSNREIDQFSFSKLTKEERDFLDDVEEILSKDPEYNRLGYNDEQWDYLWTESKCLPRAMAIKKSDELILNRPLLQLVLDIDDLERTPKGELLKVLSSQAEKSKKLKDIAEVLKIFIEDNPLVIAPLGIALEIIKKSSEMAFENLESNAQASAIEDVYKD